jgi:hypothetical protein
LQPARQVQDRFLQRRAASLAAACAASVPPSAIRRTGVRSRARVMLHASTTSAAVFESEIPELSVTVAVA